MKCLVPEESKVYSNFAFILEITDEQVELIRNDPSRITHDTRLLAEMAKSKGNNAHILQLTLLDKFPIACWIEKLRGEYDSVSWVNDNNKFYLVR